MSWVGVLGYGCDPDGKGIRDYVDFACYQSTFLKSSSPYQTAIIFSGGFTNPKGYPEISEAMMMERIAREMGSINPIYREEESLTTIQNIRNLKNLWIEKVTGEYSVIIREKFPLGIICDQNRAFKISYIARHIFGEKIPIIGFDFQRTLKEKAMILAGTMKDIVAIHSPRVEDFFLNQRKREIGLTT